VIYWKPLAALALLACAWFAGWTTRGWKADADQLATLQASFDRIAESDREAAKADAALRQLLKAGPKAGPTIRTVVRENPSDCRVPAPVFDGLRDAIRSANEAAR
jgi:hypothetical protein